MMPMITRLGGGLLPATATATSTHNAGASTSSAAGPVSRREGSLLEAVEVHSTSADAAPSQQGAAALGDLVIGTTEAAEQRQQQQQQQEASPARHTTTRRRRNPAAQAAAAAAEARLVAAQAAVATTMAAGASGEEGGGNPLNVQGLGRAQPANEEVGGLGTNPAPASDATRPTSQRPGQRDRQRTARRSSASAAMAATGPAAPAGLDLVVGPSSGSGLTSDTLHTGASSSAAARVHRGLVGLPRIAGAQLPPARKLGAGDADLMAILEGRPLGGQSPDAGHSGTGNAPLLARVNAAAAAAATAAAARAAAALDMRAGQQFGISGHSVGAGVGAGAGIAEPSAHGGLPTQPLGRGHGPAGAGSKATSRPPRWNRPLPGYQGASEGAHGFDRDTFGLDGRSLAPLSLAPESPPRVAASARASPARVDGQRHSPTPGHLLAPLQHPQLQQQQQQPGEELSLHIAYQESPASGLQGPLYEADHIPEARASMHTSGSWHDRLQVQRADEITPVVRAPSPSAVGGMGIAAAMHLRRSVSAGARTPPAPVAMSMSYSSSPGVDVLHQLVQSSTVHGAGTSAVELAPPTRSLHLAGRLAESQDSVLLASMVGLGSAGLGRNFAGVSDSSAGGAAAAAAASTAWERLFDNPVYNVTPSASLNIA